MSSPVWLVRQWRGAATCVLVPRSSITPLMSKVTINLSIKSKTNKRQKMMHHPNSATPHPPQTETVTTEYIWTRRFPGIVGEEVLEGDAKHNSALSCFVASPPWNDCFTQMNRLNISCMFGEDGNKSFKSAFSSSFPLPPLNKAIS